jgi:eukaryotic-like serine/threonine-protein kinase
MPPGYLLRNRYRIKQRLSGGAFGETYIAVDENPDYPIERKVVVKHLKPQNNDPETLKVARELFEKEAKTLAKLGETTDRIPTLYAYFEEKAKVGEEEKSEFYLVQELIEGQTLSKELENCKLSEIDTLKIIQNILIGLEKVHNSNNIHRDLKPDNIIRRNSNDKLVLIDFGAVKAVRQGTNPQISQTIGIGTPGYMPGEQWRGSPQFASDIYAVGAVALKCLTGIEPYELLDKDSGEFKWRHLCQVSDRVANVLYKMVAILHPDRYANATIAKQEIDRLLIALSNNPLPQSTKQPINQPAPVQATKPAINNPQPLQPPPAPIKQPSPPQQQKQPAKNPEPIQRAKKPSPTIVSPRPIDRRKMIKWLGIGGTGTIGVLLLPQLFKGFGKQQESGFSSLSGSKLQPSLSTIEFASVKVNDKGDIIARPKGKAQIYKEDLGKGVILTMVKIPAGSFLMGSPESEKKRNSSESPQHRVTLKEFYMGQTEITQSQYQAIMGENPAEFKGNNLPVETVSWNQAQEFCRKLSTKTARNYTLPSESQWEYACRAGTTTPFYFGYISTSNLANHQGKIYGNGTKGLSRNKTTKVGEFLPNSFGLYDMHGNVAEWCQDLLHENYQDTPIDGSAWTSGIDEAHIVRGGHWLYEMSDCRSANRTIWSSEMNYIGFRVVCKIPMTL